MNPTNPLSSLLSTVAEANTEASREAILCTLLYRDKFAEFIDAQIAMVNGADIGVAITYDEALAAHGDFLANIFFKTAPASAREYTINVLAEIDAAPSVQ